MQTRFAILSFKMLAAGLLGTLFGTCAAKNREQVLQERAEKNRAKHARQRGDYSVGHEVRTDRTARTECKPYLIARRDDSLKV